MALLYCSGSVTLSYTTCSVLPGGYCSSSEHSGTYSCLWYTGTAGSGHGGGAPPGQNCFAVGDLDTNPVGAPGSCTCDANNNWSGVGCSVCDEDVCKSGTTSYTQACGDTTRDYKCTNECGWTKYWTTYDNACKECGPVISAWSAWSASCGSAHRSRTCSENCGTDDCAPVSTYETECFHCAPTISDWSSCDSNHEKHRTCTENDGACDGDDCAPVSLTEDCIGSVTGTYFDASDAVSCSDMAASPKFSSVTLPISPDVTNKWPVRNTPVRTNTSGLYSASVFASASLPSSYSIDFTNYLASDQVVGVRWRCNGNENNISVTGDGQTVTRNFGFWRVFGGWWQAEGGSVYAKGGVTSVVPASVTPTSNQRLVLPDGNGRSGFLSYGVAWNGTELGANPTATPGAVFTQNTYTGLRYDYNFYKTRMDVFEATDWDGGTISYNPGGPGYQIFKHTGNVNLSYSGPTGTQKVILLVDGDVTVNSNVTVPSGAFFAIVSSGKIEFNPGMFRADGWYVAETISVPCSDDAAPLGTCDKDDSQFQGNGSFVGWTGISLKRDMFKANNTNPSEKFTYRPDLFLNVPAPMKVYTRKFSTFVP